MTAMGEPTADRRSPAASARAGVTQPDARPLVSAEDITLSAGGRTILDRVSLAIAPGEIVTLLGPNGSGKTTLLKVLLGLVRPDSGRVVRREGITVGYVPQRFPLDGLVPMSVARLVTLTYRPPPSRLEAVLEETGIAHLRHADVTTLSGGEFQRAVIARALIRQPDLLVLDEPLQGVDFSSEAHLYRLIGGIRRSHGCGIILVSHDLHVVMAESDRVICLNRHVCCEGVPAAVEAHPEFVRLFGPGAARALAVYRHDHDHVHEAIPGEETTDQRHDDHAH